MNSSNNINPAPIREVFVYVILVVVSILIRLPFLSAFDLVSYDGTYYINQAKFLLGHHPVSGAFPFGYPALIALFIPIIKDTVRAAQIVSFLANLMTICTFYLLCKQLVQRKHAIIASLLLMLTPLFIRLSLMTLSESVYMCWLILGLYMYARQRNMLSGFSMGMATITRPEALGIFALLAVLRRRKAAQLGFMLVSFLIIYALNSAILSKALGRTVILPKAGLFGSGEGVWEKRESWIDFAGKAEIDEELEHKEQDRNVVWYYLTRSPKELFLLAKHVTPFVLLLALYGMCIKRTYLIASLLPFLFYPLFTLRTAHRFVLPFVPILILYALIGVEHLPKRIPRLAVYMLLAVSTITGLSLNWEQLTERVANGYEWAKRDGTAFGNKVDAHDKIADRKPFFAFYAGGTYVEIPISTYEELLEYLVAEDIKYLVLHRETVHYMRPALKPLLYDRAFIRGETRYTQAYYHPDGVLVYERTEPEIQTESHPFVSATIDQFTTPSWSPDGKSIACRKISPSGEKRLCIISSSTGEMRDILEVAIVWDPISWSPDSKKIAFADDLGGNVDLFECDVISRSTARITTEPSDDRSPSWSRNGKEIVFISNRSGQKHVWSKNLETEELNQITTRGVNSFPAVSPDGHRIAYIQQGEGLVILDRISIRTKIAELPKQPTYAAAWSPEGQYLAVTGEGYGGADVYLLRADGENALILTKSGRSDGMPSWNPNGKTIACVTKEDEKMNVEIISGIEPYLRRLVSPPPVETFEMLPEIKR